MPSEHQKIFENDSAPEGAAGDFGNSHKDHLSDAFPASPLHGGPKGTLIDTGAFGEGDVPDTTPVVLSSENYRKFYADYVMSGEKNIPGSSFGAGVNLDYHENGVAEHGSSRPSDEPAVGEKGSTISSTGLGPNVNTLDIDYTLTNPADGLECIEPSNQVGTPNDPLATSTSIGQAGIYGGSTKDGSGNFGESQA